METEIAQQKRIEIRGILSDINKKLSEWDDSKITTKKETAKEALDLLLMQQEKIQEDLDWLHAHQYTDHVFNGLLHEGEHCQGECAAKDFRRLLDAIQPGTVIVYRETSFTTYIGRVEGEVHSYLLKDALEGGISTEFDLLEADQHQEAAQIFFEGYSSMHMSSPPRGIYMWPEMAKTLTFTQLGSLRHIQVPFNVGPYFVHELQSRTIA